MDLDKALRQLYEERKRLDRTIARLEARLATLSDRPKRSTRGRKSMGPEERLVVSARMTAYWAERRLKLASKKESEATAIAEPESAANEPSV